MFVKVVLDPCGTVDGTRDAKGEEEKEHEEDDPVYVSLNLAALGGGGGRVHKDLQKYKGESQRGMCGGCIAVMRDTLLS